MAHIENKIVSFSNFSKKSSSSSQAFISGPAFSSLLIDFVSFAEYYFDPRPILQDPKYTVQVEFLSKRLEEEIRAAKKTHLSCGEVLLPCGLLQKISEDILKISEKELCGIRGMNLYLLFEGEEDCRRLSNFKMDPTTPSTFEVYLTFKQANAGWGFLPQFLK